MDVAKLLWLDVGRPYQLAPPFRFFGHELPELYRCHGDWRHTAFGKSSPDAGIGKAGVDFLIERGNDLRRSVSRRAEAVPPASRVARHELGHGGDVRQGFRALCGCHCERQELAASDVFDGSG